MDNFITGSHSNASHLVNHPNFRLIKRDIIQYIQVEQPLDYILHFACPASPSDYLKYPIRTLKAGALGTHNAPGLAKSKGARFLLASTSEVYGDPLVHPQWETCRGNVDPADYRGVYDESKRFAETMTMAYHRHHAVDTRIVRIFNTFGPRIRLDDGRALPPGQCALTIVLTRPITPRIFFVKHLKRRIPCETFISNGWSPKPYTSCGKRPRNSNGHA